MSQNKKWDDLTDNVGEGEGFDIRGKEYFLRYPLTHEVEEMQTLAEEQKQSQSDTDKEKQKEANDKLEAFIYGLITPVGHDTPVKEALSQENIKVMARFNVMIRTALDISV